MIATARTRLVLVLVVFALLSVAVMGCTRVLPAGTVSTPTQATPQEVPPELRSVWEVWSVLSRDYVDPGRVDPEKLSQGAIRGMLEALDDPYTSYVPSDHYHLEAESYRGKFEGIGAEVSMRDGRLTVVTPLDGSPAERAGIRAGDVILEVDGQSIAGKTLLEAIQMIRGPEGTTVSLLVLRQQPPGTEQVRIVRDEIKVATATWKMLDGSVAYLRVGRFVDTTPDEVRGALKQIQEQGATGLLLDLRNNPGGLLSATVTVASQFLKDGLVLYEVDRAGERRDWPVRQGGLEASIPMVVVVNRSTASGAEVLAGALQARGRATLVGTQTFGKGSVTLLRELSDGSGLYVTYARWYTPDGRLIQGEGLAPDSVVEQPENSDTDLQLARAMELLSARLLSTSTERG